MYNVHSLKQGVTIRYRHRFFDQDGHQTTYAFIGNRSAGPYRFGAMGYLFKNVGSSEIVCLKQHKNHENTTPWDRPQAQASK